MTGPPAAIARIAPSPLRGGGERLRPDLRRRPRRPADREPRRGLARGPPTPERDPSGHPPRGSGASSGSATRPSPRCHVGAPPRARGAPAAVARCLRAPRPSRSPGAARLPAAYDVPRAERSGRRGARCPPRSPPAPRPEAVAPLADHAQLRFEPVALPFTGGDRALQRFDLHPAPDGLLPGPPPELVHLAPVLIGVSERGLGFVELPLPFGELSDGPLQIRLDARELGLDRVEPGRAAGLGGELLSRSASRSRALRNACSASDRSACAERNRSSLSASRLEAAARSSAPASTSASSASNRARASSRSARPSSQPPLRRSRSASSAPESCRRELP